MTYRAAGGQGLGRGFIEIGQRGPGPAVLRDNVHAPVFGKDSGYLGSGIVGVAEDAAVHGTDGHTGRSFSGSAGTAVIALVGRAGVGIDEPGMVRTRFHAASAADAARFVDFHCAVFPFPRGAGRTCAHAGRIVTVHAGSRLKSEAAGSAVHDGFVNPVPRNAVGDVVALLAGQDAGLAVHALV